MRKATRNERIALVEARSHCYMLGLIQIAERHFFQNNQHRYLARIYYFGCNASDQIRILARFASRPHHDHYGSVSLAVTKDHIFRSTVQKDRGERYFGKFLSRYPFTQLFLELVHQTLYTLVFFAQADFIAELEHSRIAHRKRCGEKRTDIDVHQYDPK